MKPAPYEMTYEFNDIVLTQEELRQHFKSNEKFFKTKEGKLIFFIIIKRSLMKLKISLKKARKIPDKWASLQLLDSPPEQYKSFGGRIYGDEYLNSMYENLLNRSFISWYPLSISELLWLPQNGLLD